MDRRPDHGSAQGRGAEAASPARLSVDCNFQFIFYSLSAETTAPHHQTRTAPCPGASAPDPAALSAAPGTAPCPVATDAIPQHHRSGVFGGSRRWLNNSNHERY